MTNRGPDMATPNGSGFRVVAGPFYQRSRLALAARYSRVEDAIANMGEGLVLTDSDTRLVAFHEKHLTVLQRLDTLNRDDAPLVPGLPRIPDPEAPHG